MNSSYRKFHFASHLMVLLGILANAVAEVDALIFLIGLVGVSVSYVLFRDRLVSPVPRWAINSMLVLALILMFRAATGELEAVVSVVAQYLSYLTLIKMFESRTPRDQAQVIMLSLLVAISAVLTSVTLQVALVLLLYVPVAFWTVVLFQLYSGQMRTHRSRVEAGIAQAALPPAIPLDRTSRRTIRRLVGITLVGVSITSAVVFFLMPRGLGSGAFGDWTPASHGATSGFNNEVRLGRPGTLTENPAVVLDVSFTQLLNDGRSLPYRPNQLHRLRGAVLDDFDHDSAVWYRSSRSEGTQRPTRVHPASTFPLGYERRGATIEVSVTMRNMQSTELFTLWKPEAIAVPGSRRRITMSPVDGVIRLRNHRGPLSYSVLVAPDAPTRIEESERRTIFERGDENIFAAEGSRIRALALEIIADRVPEFDASDPRTIRQPGVAERIATMFSDYLSNNYDYTLDMMVLGPDDDPIEAFLFDQPAGHCEYFASALAALCRSVWIDARVITGFVATEYDQASQRYTVRQSHAHAWVEALVERQLDVSPITDDPVDGDEDADQVPTIMGDFPSGPLYIETWKTYDPSPRMSLQAIHSPPSGVMARARQWFDELQFAWSSNVIGFNRTRQTEILQADSDGPLGLFRAARELAERTRSDRDAGTAREDLIRSILSFASVFAIIIAAAGAGVVLRKLVLAYLAKAKTRGRFADDPARLERERQSRFFRSAMTLLKSRGVARPAHLPASLHAATIEAQTPAAGAAFRTLTSLYYESHYGHRILSDEQMAEAQRALDQLSESLPRKSA
ncbi:MAG: transglutaminase TgpA family protein [Phycisphaerales bacterium]